MDKKTPFKGAMILETRMWIAVIATLLLTEVGMHVFGHDTLPLWGLVIAAILFGTTFG